jgi:hypothetical protein
MTARTLILALTVGLAGCAGDDPITTATPPMTRLLPAASELSGWTAAEGPAEYSPDTLYEYLNGGAERYQSHGFCRLLHIRYQLGGDPLACVTLDLYDMGSELGAFGIYSAARPAGLAPRQWGAQGYRNGNIAGAYRGSIFIHGEADDDRQELVEMLEKLVSGVAGGADGSVSPPAILAPLPQTHRQAGSERYVPSNLLGHSFLPGGVLASYEVDGRQAELFFTDPGAEAEAVAAVAALRAHFESRETIARGEPTFGDDGFRTTDPIFGQGSVVRSGNLIAGIHGDMLVQEREDILSRLIAEATEVASRR